VVLAWGIKTNRGQPENQRTEKTRGGTVFSHSRKVRKKEDENVPKLLDGLHNERRERGKKVKASR